MKYKFKGRSEPCVQYSIVDPVRILQHSEHLNKICSHVRIEVVGYIPEELLEPVEGHKQNMNAIDYYMHKNHQGN
jgi:hypothetical protein